MKTSWNLLPRDAVLRMDGFLAAALLQAASAYSDVAVERQVGVIVTSGSLCALASRIPAVTSFSSFRDAPLMGGLGSRWFAQLDLSWGVGRLLAE